MRKLLILVVLLLVTAFPLSGADELKKYVGRYELEPGVVPISTLDVTFADGTLWVQNSLARRRKLIPRSKSAFVDEIEGKKYSFSLNEKGDVQSLTFEFEGETYTARKLILPAPSVTGNTTFILKGYPEAHIIALAGTFNAWRESQLIFAKENGAWVCRIDLTPGKYTYKFIVDGTWIIDPANSRTEEDEAGNVNSVLLIEKK